MPIRTLLFDLDGTLADTAPDLAEALNHVLREAGREPLPYETIRPVVSHGSPALLKLGFAMDEAHPDYAKYRQTLLNHYLANIARHTTLFAGMAELLAEVEESGRNWGVVTNKPAFLTEPLMAALGIAERAATIVSGDTLTGRKPHPAPMLLACCQAGSAAAQCLYVGDAARDIEAGRAAGMPTLAALWGYIEAHDDPAEWRADGYIEHPREILAWL